MIRLQPVYLVVGCPGSGKSWVCDQLKDLFTYVHHDLHIGMAGEIYTFHLNRAANRSPRPILAEAPFSISAMKGPLESVGIRVIPVFIQEDPDVIKRRHRKREGRSIPVGHLTRQKTYALRAKQWKAFIGTSEEVLEHLKKEATRHER